MTTHVPTDAAAGRSRHDGFTLIELVVVMGILAGFLVMLVQLVDGGVRMFGEGEAGQLLADRGSRAQDVLSRELRTLRGSVSGRDRTVADDRLVVQWLPIGLPPQAERGATRVQVLRAAVHLDVDRESALLDELLTGRVLREAPKLGPSELAQRVAELRAREPLRGLGNLLLLPSRQEGDDDALLELRAGWFLPGQKIPVRDDRWVDPFAVPVPGSADLPGTLVRSCTEPILRDLLHVEFWFWSQRTTRWPADGGAEGDAERVWDSARGGWLTDEASGGTWSFDRGPASLEDTTDDIQPHAVLVRCVVAAPGEAAPEGLLASELAEGETTLVLANGERFPGADDGGFVKIDGEWLGYGERRGDRLQGLRRGQRGTKEIAHRVGARVHVGRTMTFVVPLAHAKDDLDG